jgi:hypothetical protein
VSPRLYRDETRRGIRPGERQILRLIGVADFMAHTTASTESPGTGPFPAAHRD